METQFNLDRKTIIIALSGLVALLAVCLCGAVIFQFVLRPSSRPVVGAATVQTRQVPPSVTPQPTQPPSTATLQPTAVLPTATPSSSAGSALTPTPVPSIAPTSTPTATVSLSQPVVSARPGIYVTRIRVAPAQVYKNEPPTFYVTFVNTTGVNQQYKWMVQIYDGQKKNRFGQTPWRLMTIAPGTKEIPTIGDWAVHGKIACLSFYARAEWQDDSGARIAFASTDGSVVSLPLTVCPR